MQQINQFLIFEFGSNVRAILTMPERATLSQISTPLFAIQETLRNLVKGEPIQLDYSMGNIRAALNQIDFLQRVEFLDKDGKFDFDKD